MPVSFVRTDVLTAPSVRNTEVGRRLHDSRHDRSVTIPEITTVRGCELAAKLIVDTAAEPRWEAAVEIPASANLDGLLEALDLDIPGEAMSIYDLTVSPERLSLRLGSRERVRETIEQIRSTVETASERV